MCVGVTLRFEPDQLSSRHMTWNTDQYHKYYIIPTYRPATGDVCGGDSRIWTRSAVDIHRMTWNIHRLRFRTPPVDNIKRKTHFKAFVQIHTFYHYKFKGWLKTWKLLGGVKFCIICDFAVIAKISLYGIYTMTQTWGHISPKHENCNYSPSHIVQITDFGEFLHEHFEEKSETFTEFYNNLVLTRSIKIICWCAVVARHQQKIAYDREFSIVKSGDLKYMNFQKGIKLDFICMKMKLMKNKKYLQQKFSWKVPVWETTTDFMFRVSKSYVPFTCKFLW